MIQLPEARKAVTPSAQRGSDLHKGCVLVLLVPVVVGLAKLHGGSGDPPVEPTPSAAFKTGGTKSATVQPALGCGPSHTQTGRDYDIGDETVLRTTPDAASAPILKPGLANDPNAAVNATITGDAPLRERCRSNGWSYVSVTAPEYIRWMQGWVPTSVLKSVPVRPDGRRIYRLADIEWQAGSEPYRSAIVKIANKIMADDRRCEVIDAQSLLVEVGSRPKFTLACVGAAGTFPVAFSAADATNGRSFAAGPAQADANDGPPISKSDAFALCYDAITAQLRQPRSVDFHTTETTFSTNGSRARFTIGFTAKNGFGNEMDKMAECVFSGARLTSAAVIE